MVSSGIFEAFSAKPNLFDSRFAFDVFPGNKSKLPQYFHVFAGIGI